MKKFIAIIMVIITVAVYNCAMADTWFTTDGENAYQVLEENFDQPQYADYEVAIALVMEADGRTSHLRILVKDDDLVTENYADQVEGYRYMRMYDPDNEQVTSVEAILKIVTAEIVSFGEYYDK